MLAWNSLEKQIANNGDSDLHFFSRSIMYMHVLIANTVTPYSQFDKMGAGFRLGKDKKHKSTSSAPRTLPPEEQGYVGPNGDPFPEVLDVDSIAEYEVNERFEQMLVSKIWFC